MELEGRQGKHNHLISSIGNASSSFDPKQLTNDATNTLIRGAEVAVAGNTLGMSEEELLYYASRKNRTQGADFELNPDNDSIRSAAQIAKSLVDEEGRAMTSIDDAQGLRTIDTYGKGGRAVYDNEFTDEDIYQGRTDIEEGFRTEGDEVYRGESRPSGYTVDTNEAIVKEKSGRDRRRGAYVDPNPPYTPEARDQREAFSRTFAQGGKKYTYKNVLKPEEETTNENLGSTPRSTYDSRTGEGSGPVTDALRRVQSGETKSRFSPAELAARRARVFGTTPETVTADERKAVEEKIIKSIDPRAAKEAERREVQALIAQDAATRSPERIQEVQAAAAAEAGDIAARQGFERGQIRPQSSMNEIEDLIQLTVDRPVASAAQRPGTGTIYYTDEYGRPITDRSDDIELMLRGDPNTPNTSQAQNAPKAQSAPSWLMANQPEYYRSETNFGNYPQTDITLATTNFANKVRELSGVDASNINLDIRSAADLQRVQDAVEAQKYARGQVLFRKDGAEQVVAEPGDVRGLMHALKMSGPEQTDLANAIIQQELASGSGGRTEAKVVGGVNPNETGVDARIAKVPANSTIRAEGGKRRNIRAELAQLEGQGAQEPFIGAVIDERTGKQETDAGPRARSSFIGAGMGRGEELERNLRRQAISRVKPGQKLDKDRLIEITRKARNLEEREATDRVMREARAASPGSPPARVEEDNQFIREARRRVEETQDAGRRSAPATQSGGGAATPPTAPAVASGNPEKKKGSGFSPLMREIVMNEANRRGRNAKMKAGAGILAGIGGVTAAGKGIYDVTRPEEEDEALMVRYA